MKIKLRRKHNQKKNVVCIFFTMMTIVFGICFALEVYSVTTYIGELLSTGSLTLSGSLLDIIIYYIDKCASLFAYTVFSFGLTCLCRKQNETENQEEFDDEDKSRIQEVQEEIEKSEDE